MKPTRKDPIYDGRRHSVDMALAKIEDATVVLRHARPLSEAETSMADGVIHQLGKVLGVYVQTPFGGPDFGGTEERFDQEAK